MDWAWRALWLGVWATIAAVIAGFGVATAARAQAPDPRLVWRTIHTEHFDITYHEPLDALAQHLADAAERANRVVGTALGYKASERTLILLSDESDDANGSASVLPRNELHLFASAPDDLSTIGDYDDWISTLVTHEHTHILHLDQIGGLPALINHLLGKTLAPNAVQPRWFIEGIATYEESARTSGGRGRSSLFDMVLRMDVLEGRVLGLDQISNDPVRWPHGDVRYLYGSRFLTFIAERYGEAALALMGRDYGRQAIPYGVNRIAKRATGFNFVELYDQFRDAMAARYQAQRDAIVSAGVVEGRSLTKHADLTRSPRYLRDGRLAYYAEDGQRSARLRTLDGTVLTRTTSEAVFAPHPDGRTLVYSQIAPYRDIYAYHDLFRLDLASGESKRLTFGLRASQPDVSDTGREVVFVTQAAGTSNIEVAQLHDVQASHRVVYRSGAFEQVFTPRYSPDGRHIAFSAFRMGGLRDILLLDRDTGEIRELTHDRAQDSGPSFSADGMRVYFSSDRTGVANVYAFDLTSGLTYQITNVVSGAYQPLVSPDGKRLVYVGYASTGYGLHELLIERVPARLAEAAKDSRPGAELARHEHLHPISAYSPWPSLPPRSYRLQVQSGALGTELAINVEGNDIASFHRYALRYAMSVETGDPSFSIGYSYGRSPLTPSLQLYREVTARSDLYVGGQSRRWFEDGIGGTAAISYNFPSILSSQAIGIDYTLLHAGKARPFGGVLDPNDPAPRLPELGFIPSAGFGYSYSDVQRQAYDISPSSGRNFGLHVAASDPVLGRNIHTVSVRWSARQFVTMPWAARHVLALRYAGGQSGGDPGRVGRFSLGGFPPNGPLLSLYDLALYGTIPSLGGTALRGYPQGVRSGTQYHQLQVEYRLPIFGPEWGIYTLPIYARRIYADVFTDAGDAFSGHLILSHVLVGAGAELLTEFELSYQVIVTLRVGLARGLSDGGVTQFYLHIGTPF